MSIEKLRNCPFCDASMHLDYDAKTGFFGPEGDHGKGCIIGCIDLRDFADEHHAVWAWNKRAGSLPCPKCADTGRMDYAGFGNG